MDTICILVYTAAILIAVAGIYYAISITKICCDEGMCVFGVFCGGLYSRPWAGCRRAISPVRLRRRN